MAKGKVISQNFVHVLNCMRKHYHNVFGMQADLPLREISNKYF